MQLPTVEQPPERKPLSFFGKGAAALLVLFGVTFLMQPRPEVDALRAGIVVGLGLIGVKLVLRRYNIEFPRRRGR
jgi:hypothetical protein